jgi:hypothetical protein
MLPVRVTFPPLEQEIIKIAKNNNKKYFFIFCLKIVFNNLNSKNILLVLF